MMQPLWEAVWSFLKNLTTQFSHFNSGYAPQRTDSRTPGAACPLSFIEALCAIGKGKINQVPLCRQMDKKNDAYPLVECYSVIKKEALTHITTWIHPGVRKLNKAQ